MGGPSVHSGSWLKGGVGLEQEDTWEAVVKPQA